MFWGTQGGVVTPQPHISLVLGTNRRSPHWWGAMSCHPTSVTPRTGRGVPLGSLGATLHVSSLIRNTGKTTAA